MNDIPEIPIIVPYGHNNQQPERADVLQFVTENCLRCQSYRRLKLILIERSDYPSQEKYAKEIYDKYIFIKRTSGPFSVGMLQNIAISKLYPSELFYVHLPDFLLPLDSILKSYQLMQKTNAPCIFPFYGAVSLTKPITEGILTNKINWELLLNKIASITSSKRFRNNIGLISHPDNPNRVQLTKYQIQIINSILPDEYNSEYLINKYTDKELWGNDTENQFNFYSSFKSPGEDEALGNFRTGPRAKPSYLCKTDTFIKVGGTTVKRKGWNCEDLWFWERLRTYDTNYSINNHGIFYRDVKISGKYPITHLWHDISVKHDYYKTAKQSIADFQKFSSLPHEEKLKLLKPINISGLKKCQEL